MFSEILSSYDDLDSDIIKNYSEFSLASLLFYGMKEGACSEQSSRMTAMDSASKNAGKQSELCLVKSRVRLSSMKNCNYKEPEGL